MIIQLPEGYDTFLDGNENQLSGGQRQRVALARALYCDPVVLLMDEPNSMMDAAGSAALNKTVRDFKALGKSVIIMTHRPGGITECDLLLVLEQGTSIAFGPRDEVMQKTLQNVEVLQRNINKKALF